MFPKGNSSDAAILDTLEKVCKVLPVDKEQCQNYIDVYGEYIISMIEQNLAADAICAAIGLCEPPVRRVKTSVCYKCQIIASTIVEALNVSPSRQAFGTPWTIHDSESRGSVLWSLILSVVEFFIRMTVLKRASRLRLIRLANSAPISKDALLSSIRTSMSCSRFSKKTSPPTASVRL